MITFTFNDKENILFVKRVGEVDGTEILDFIKTISEQFEERKCLYILTDITDSNTIYDTAQLSNFIDEIEIRITPFEKVYEAVVTDSPHDTAMSILFENMALSLNKYTCKTFAVESNALKWIEEVKNF